MITNPSERDDFTRSSAKHLESHTLESNYRQFSKRWKMFTTKGIACHFPLVTIIELD